MKTIKPFVKAYSILATGLIIAILAVRVLSFLFHIPLNGIFYSITEMLLYPIPGNLAGLNLAEVGFDVHGVMGIMIYTLLIPIFTAITYKLFRETKRGMLAGVIDVWAWTMMILLIVGTIFHLMRIQEGASLITDIPVQLVRIASKGSMISEPSFMGIALTLGVLVITILVDKLTSLRFGSVPNDHITTKDLAVSEFIQTGVNVMAENIDKEAIEAELLEVKGKIKIHSKEVIDFIYNQLFIAEDKNKLVIPWKHWTIAQPGRVNLEA